MHGAVKTGIRTAQAPLSSHLGEEIFPERLDMNDLKQEATGLSSAAAADLLKQYGANAVPEKKSSMPAKFLRKFWGVVPWMLEAAIVLDIALRRWTEALIIAALLVFNGLIGLMQEGRAQGALMLLRQKLTVSARVLRDGDWQTMPASMLVPGDRVRLRAGDIVPADVGLTGGAIQANQSQLTGEALPVEKTAGDVAYAGSSVNRGEGTGLVTATGARTNFGKTAELVSMAEAPRRLELLIVRIAKYLAALVVVVAGTAMAAALIQGKPLIDMLPFGLLLLVASVPVAMPMMFTLSSALGARMLAENGILVARLPSIQDAAAMDVLCIDKTGTLTENILRVEKVQAFAPATADVALRLATWCSEEDSQDPIDQAILEAARERGLTENGPERLRIVPFDPDTKRTEATIRQAGRDLRIVKGAPAAIVPFTGTAWDRYAADVAKLSAGGARVLAVASGFDSDLHIDGLIALADPPRADAAALIKDLQMHGLRIILATGDGEATAREVASKVGITGEMAPAGILRERPDPALIERYGIYAGVFPEDKYFLVQALQTHGHVVGMTGDGTNDAPALRQADVGIATAGATDVAKAAASLVLTRPGLSEIVMAIEGSRRIYQRIMTFGRTMVSMKLSIPPFLALVLLVFGVYAVDPVMMILLFFSTDIVMMTVSMDRVIGSPSPDAWSVRPLLAAGLGLAGMLLVFSGAVFWTSANVLRLNTAETRTLVFAWLVFGVQAIIYVNRVRGNFWTVRPGRSVILATLFDLVLVTTLASQGYLMAAVPISLVGGLMLLALIFLVVADLFKTLMLRGGARIAAVR